jgi:hypothetical protein
MPGPTDQDHFKTALENARWRGEMEQRMRDGDSRFEKIDKTLERIEVKQDEQADDIATMKVKVAIYGAIGGMAGSVVVGLIVAIGTKGIG